MSKKKRSGSLAVMLVILAVVVGGYFIVRAVTAAPAEEPQEEDAAIKLIDEGDTPLLSLSYHAVEADLTMSISLQDDKFRLTDEPDYPLSQSTVQSLVKEIATVDATSLVSDTGSAEDAAKYGFDAPLYTGKFVFAPKESATRTYEFELGSYLSYGDEYYFRFVGAKEIYTVGGWLAGSLETDRLDLLAKESIPTVDVDAVHTVTVTCDGKTNVMTHRDAITKLVPLYTTLARASVLDPVPKEDALKEYGLGGGNSVRFDFTETVHLTDSDTGEVTDVEREGSVTVALGCAPSDNDGICVQFDGLQYVYRADKAAVESVLAYVTWEAPAENEEETAADTAE